MRRMLLSEDGGARDGADPDFARNIGSRGVFGLRPAYVVGGAWGTGAGICAKPEPRLPRPSQLNPHKDRGRRQQERRRVQHLRAVQHAHRLLPGDDRRLFQPVSPRVRRQAALPSTAGRGPPCSTREALQKDHCPSWPTKRARRSFQKSGAKPVTSGAVVFGKRQEDGRAEIRITYRLGKPPGPDAQAEELSLSVFKKNRGSNTPGTNAPTLTVVAVR